MHHRQPETQLLESIEPAIDVGDDGLSAGRIGHDRFGRRLVRGQETLANLWIPFAGGCRPRGVDERVGDAAHGGGDDGNAVSALERRRDEGGGLGDTFGGPDRGPAELHNDEHMAGSIIDETPGPAESARDKAGARRGGS